jgi:hypothetical protein
MRTITALSLLFALVTTALAQQFQDSDSPDVTVTVISPAGNSVFFAANGNDSNPCTQDAPCLTLQKASSFAYQPGSTINFRGGDTFPGEFHLTRAQVPSGGDPNNPIIIQSDGTSRATIASNQDGVNSGVLGPKNWALLVDSTSGVTIQDINVTANGFYVQYGIIIQNRAATGTIRNIIVQRVDVGGFTIRGPVQPGEGGIQLEIAGLSEVINRGVCGAIDNVQILDSKFHGNDGIASEVTEGVHTKHCGKLTNIVYRGNEVFHIGGRSDVGGGNGLFMQGVSGGLIEHNLVHHNMYNVHGCGGPVGIWAYQSDHITIQFNEVHHMHANNWVPGSCDFGAFDFDAGVFDSVMQYNYSHDNDGPAWLSFQGDGRHIIRYNVSVNDNITQNDGGAVAILNADADWVQFYNNTVIGAAACWGTGTTPPAGSIIVNNICIGTAVGQDGNWFGGGTFGGGNISNIDIRNNLYWLAVPGHRPIFTFNFWSLAQWQANMGKDQNSLVADPNLVNLTASRDITWDPTQHTGPQPQPSSYQLTHGSPAIGAGAVIPNNGGRDYYGNAVTSTVNIGADAGTH